jgi:effector-binding domain-containing protein
MTDYEVSVKSVPTVRVAELTGTAEAMDPSSIGPVVQGLYDQLSAGLGRAGLVPTGPAIAYYEDADDGAKTVVHAALPVETDLSDEYDFTVTDLPAEPQMATLLHTGSMDNCLPAYQTLDHWIKQGGYRAAGPSREVTLAFTGDVDGWVTELQQPIEKV